MSRTDARRADLLSTVEAAQTAAGILAARNRGDTQGAAVLLAGMSHEQLASGSLLLAELSMSLYARSSGQEVQDCIRGLSADLENAVRHA